MGRGFATIGINIDSKLFYKVLSEESGIDITGHECELFSCVKELSKSRKTLITSRLMNRCRNGYGIVMPTIEELSLEEPEIIKQSGKYGIRLKVSAPSIHMMKIYTKTEVIDCRLGTAVRGVVSYLLKEFEEKPKIWESNIFGKSA